ncbi:RNA-directed DNA polymerase [Brucella pituitosa]|uniref:reverse transcriptase family protein n=1 Tax=Brucella pituitosa TaxID=571256 RepID=UPI002004D93A|nr:reverse transcriptase family protein [Brucella pituitosa]MCK4205972.1 RNA-directed DNA polymerase [Brucella pituitosa]
MSKFKIANSLLQIQLDLFDDFRNLSREEIIEEYRNNIASKGAFVLYDTKHISKILGYEESILHAMSTSPQHFYREFEVAKKSGGVRVINEPFPTLKEIQRFILDYILCDVEPHKAARAFRKNYTLRGAAIIHKSRRYMLKLDIKNFFSSIKSFSIYKIYYDLGYTSQIASLLSGLCTLGGRLPQGAPTSPLLSNLFLKDFDQYIFDHCKNNSIFYTRYADDMTFSSNEQDMKYMVGFVRGALSRHGLKLNHKKTSLSGKGARKFVNGIVVNEKPNILKEERRLLRQTMYYIRNYGIDGHMRVSNIDTPNYIDHLLGKLTFAYFVTKDESYKDDINYIRSIKRILR